MRCGVLCGVLRHLTAPVRASARKSIPELKSGFFLPFDAGRLAGIQPCASVSEPLPDINSAVNVATGPDTRQQTQRVANAETEAPGHRRPCGLRSQGRRNPDIERIVDVACPVEPFVRRVFSNRDNACQNMSRIRSSRRLPRSERLSHSVAIVAHTPFIRSPSGMMPWAGSNLACCAGMTFRSEGPICGSEPLRPSLLPVTRHPAPDEVLDPTFHLLN